MSGYYSIVQFMPRPDRHEGINFGILLLDRQTGMFDAMLLYPYRRINSLFPGTTERLLDDLTHAFHARIRAQEIQDLDGLTEFVLTRGGLVQCTEPEYIEIPAHSFYVTMEDLLTKLVR